VATIRALSEHLGHPLPLDRQSALAFEVEKTHHGTPSGIDNMVVTYDRPIYFRQGKEPEPFSIGAPLTLVIGDTGLRSPTSFAVGRVRRRWEQDRGQIEAIFDAIGEIVDQARQAIARGEVARLGLLMDRNQALLKTLGVSSPELEALIEAARQAGAGGAKLSGAGLGGNMIALVEAESAATVARAVRSAGGVRTLRAEVAG